MKNNPDIAAAWDSTLTIVVPTFNSIEELPACLESVQNVLGELIGKAVFVVIQDGQSTDGTREYAENINAKGITLVSERDKGVYDAMNNAITRADTDWIYFLGSDDRLLPDFKVMLGQLTNTNHIYYANVRFASSDKRYDGNFSTVKLAFRNICHQSMFFPSHILREDPYSLDYPVKSDWASNIRFFASIPFQHVDLDVALYNDNGGLSSTYEDVQFEKEKANLFYESHGYWMKLVCFVVPTTTRAFHLLSRRKKKTPGIIRNT
ncbi:glycosyltransferase [Haliea sp.]